MSENRKRMRSDSDDGIANEPKRFNGVDHVDLQKLRVTNLGHAIANLLTMGVLADRFYGGKGNLLISLWKHGNDGCFVCDLSQPNYDVKIPMTGVSGSRKRIVHTEYKMAFLTLGMKAFDVRLGFMFKLASFLGFTKMPLQLTKPAPQWRATAVFNGEFKDIALSDYKGKYVVLFFYPLDFTFVCPTEIIAFSERADDFRKIDCEIIAASTDSHFTHLAWINTPRKQGGLGPMNIPIIADKNHSIARDYGILDEDSGVPFRGLFIIDDKQRLRQVTINDLPVGRSVDETLRLVQAFQYTDKHGEVCPANWQPGAKTIKPNTKEAKEFFVNTE